MVIYCFSVHYISESIPVRILSSSCTEVDNTCTLTNPNWKIGWPIRESIRGPFAYHYQNSNSSTTPRGKRYIQTAISYLYKLLVDDVNRISDLIDHLYQLFGKKYQYLNYMMITTTKYTLMYFFNCINYYMKLILIFLVQSSFKCR